MMGRAAPGDAQPEVTASTSHGKQMRRQRAQSRRAPEGHRMLSPSELARLTGVSTDTLRHYERKGVPRIPARSQGGYRLYPPEAVGHVRLVRRALAIGFTLVISRRSCRSVIVGARRVAASARWWLSGSPVGDAPPRSHRVARRAASATSGVGPPAREDSRRTQARLLDVLADRPVVDRAVARQPRTIGSANPRRRLERRQ